MGDRRIYFFVIPAEAGIQCLSFIATLPSTQLWVNSSLPEPTARVGQGENPVSRIKITFKHQGKDLNPDFFAVFSSLGLRI